MQSLESFDLQSKHIRFGNSGNCPSSFCIF